jgi:hypothetical protein
MRANKISKSERSVKKGRRPLGAGSEQLLTSLDMARLLTSKEAAAVLGLSEAWLNRNRWEGKRGRSVMIPFVRVGRSIRYSQEALAEYIRGRSEGAQLKTLADATPRRKRNG